MRSRFRDARLLPAPLLLALICAPVSLALAQTPAATRDTPTVAPLAARLLKLDEAIRLALASNPDLASARLELQAMEAAEIQAGARPNPELGVLVEDTRAATRTTTVQVAQPIELGGKRSARLAAAASAREQAAVALQGKEAEVRASVASAFFELLSAQEQVKLTQASLTLAGNAANAASKRLQAGKVPPLEQARAQVAEAGVRAELAQAQSDLRLARQRLSSLWGQAVPQFDQADGAAETLPTLPTDQWVGEQLSQAPAVRLAQLDVARRQALVDGERAKRVPDLTVTMGAKRDAELGRTQAVVGLSIPLPLLDTNRGNLLEAMRREEQSRQALTVATLQLNSEVAQTLEKLRLTSEQAQLLRTDVLPTAQSAYDAAVRGYELGKFAFLDVLDAQRTLFQLRKQSLRTAADAWRAAADLDRLLGRSAQASQE